MNLVGMLLLAYGCRNAVHSTNRDANEFAGTLSPFFPLSLSLGVCVLAFSPTNYSYARIQSACINQCLQCVPLAPLGCFLFK